ncbi:MAG: hypothetical protein GWN07_07670, partial [Actinobacteria bacterium]|nr:hypothetical protein [Actinomycetota bacterium]NIV86352.1 hypothetical protein [Actinomycetota bacterium]NIW27158.1 hypothetical protein [Actinomycetota bacterium]NIX19709.1 hypothetical protein [Actinomycetota bacterium]
MLATVFTKSIRDRWRGVAVGVAILGAMLMFGMQVYQGIDLSVYTDLPDALRSLVGIDESTDAAGLAYGAMYASYGALTLGSLALSIGAA